MVIYYLSVGLWGATNQRWGDRIKEDLGDVESTLEGIRGKTFTKIEAHSGMAERLVRDLAIEESLQEEIKQTLEHNHQSYGDWCALSYK